MKFLHFPQKRNLLRFIHTPKYKQETHITLKQLYIFSKHADEKATCKFLCEEFSKRFFNQHEMISSIPNEKIRNLASINILKQSLKNSFEKLSNLPPNLEIPKIGEISSNFKEMQQILDTNCSYLVSELEEFKSKSKEASKTINLILDSIFYFLIQFKTFSDQFVSVFDSKKSIINYEDVVDITQAALEDVQYFCLSKNNVHMDVDVNVPSNQTLRVLCDPSHIYFIMTELIKNAMQTHLNKYGLAIHEAPRIQISFNKVGNFVEIFLKDFGEGMPPGKVLNDYFSSTAVKREPNYTYSGDFGEKFQGFGVGLPKSLLYVKMLNGSLNVKSKIGEGTDVKLKLDIYGNGPIMRTPVYFN